MNHYFFKFGPANYFLKKCIEKRGQNGSLALHSSLPLSIYFKKWTVEDYDAGTVNNGKNKDQIDVFFRAVRIDQRNTVFWLFDDYIYALIPQSAVHNGTMTKDEDDYTHPKAVDATIVKKFSKEELPEAFASINSYQKYNRKTIVELKKPEKEIADWVYTHGSNCKMPIPKNRKFCFLSPLQFETLIFLIFHHNNIFCTTYRGGTREGIDFNVKAHKEVLIEGMHLNGNVSVQVKKCDCLLKHQDLKLKNDVVLVHLGESHPERHIHGRDWIESCLKQLPVVENWLNKSLDFFKLSDEI